MLDEIRIGQETDVEAEVKFRWQAMLESETHQRELGGLCLGFCEPVRNFPFERMDAGVAGIQDAIRALTKVIEEPSLPRDRFCDSISFIEWMKAPRLLEPPDKHLISTVEEEQCEVMFAGFEAIPDGSKVLQKSRLTGIDNQSDATELASCRIGKANERFD